MLWLISRILLLRLFSHRFTNRLMNHVSTFILLSLITLTSSCRTTLTTMDKPDHKHQIYTHDGQTVRWKQMMTAVNSADIVVVGEIHNNAYGHQLEAQMADQFLAGCNRAAIAMEMFDRRQQQFVNLYLDGSITARTLEKVTGSSNWGGSPDTWSKWYQPIVDSVLRHRMQGAALIAANAPRSYVKLARLAGFDQLQQLKTQGTDDFELPDPKVDDTRYREKFMNLMKPDSKIGQTKKMPMHRKPMDYSSTFRAQQVWDATMATSVVRALKTHHKVMLFAGNFHIADNGGTTLRIKHKQPHKKIVSISILSSKHVGTFNKNDQGHADFIIYTGTK